MVMLRPPAVAEDIESRRFVASYMRDHFDSWLEFANASDSSWGGLGLRPEDVFFVCGTLKTTQWALAAFQGSAFRNKDGVVSGQLDRTGDVQFSVQIDGQPLPTTHQRAGPAGRPSGAPDQCLFIRYYKMKRRLLGREPMQAAAGPHQLPPGPDNSGPDAMSPGRAPRASPAIDNECNDTYYDPVNHLLDYILRTSEADIAIASDSDLVALFRDGTFPADVPAALTELSPVVEVDEHGVGTMSVDHGSVEMERLSDERAYTYRGHEDMSQDLPATCPLESPEAPSCMQSTPRDFAAPALRQSTVYSPASQGEPNPQRSKDGVDWTAAGPEEDMVSPTGEKYATAVPDSMTTSIRDVRNGKAGQEVRMRDGAPMVAPRALSCGDGYLTSASALDYLARPLLVTVDA